MANARPIDHRLTPLLPDTVFTMSPATAFPQRATRFWVYTGIGVLVMSVAWCWYGLAQLEAESEQGKAVTAETTMDGFALAFGGIPLIAAHIIGLAILLPLGWQRWRLPGLAYGLVAVAVASVIGIGAGQLLFGGELFEVGLHRYYDD
ncbi:hypothetical protein [Leucobacter aridicollis]